MGQVALHRVGGLAQVIVILTALVGVLGIVSTILTGLAIDDARAFLRDEITEDEFLDSYAAGALLGGAQGFAIVAILVLTMIWMYRLAANHRTLGRGGTWAPLWAIFGWFLPPLVLYVIPYLMFRELWRASDPDQPVAGDGWRTGRVAPVVTVWWVLYGIVPIVVLVWQGLDTIAGGIAETDAAAFAEMLDEQYTVSLVSALINAAAAVAYILLVRGLTGRHRRLTGEDVARR
jgi:hypothetical protein